MYYWLTNWNGRFPRFKNKYFNRSFEICAERSWAPLIPFHSEYDVAWMRIPRIHFNLPKANENARCLS